MLWNAHSQKYVVGDVREVVRALRECCAENFRTLMGGMGENHGYKVDDESKITSSLVLSATELTRPHPLLFVAACERVSE